MMGDSADILSHEVYHVGAKRVSLDPCEEQDQSWTGFGLDKKNVFFSSLKLLLTWVLYHLRLNLIVVEPSCTK